MTTSSSFHLVRQKPAIAPVAPRSIRRIFDNSQLIERFNKWLMVCGKSEHTRVAYVFAARKFAEFIQDKPLTAATRNDVTAFLGSLYAKNFAPSTLQARLDALRVLFDCLQLGSQVHVSAARYIPRRKLPRRLPGALSEKQIGGMIKAAHSPRDLAIIELAYASALRRSELAHLRIEDVNLKGGTLIVRRGKGGNDRVALFGRPAADALRNYIGDRTSGPVFLQHPLRQRGGVTRGKAGAWLGQWREGGKLRNVRLGDFDIGTRERARKALDAFLKDKLPPREPDSKSLGVKGIWRVITSTAKRAGINGVHPHSLRHSCATHCLNRGMDIRHVQELLGHSSLITTQKYLHVATANLKGVHSKFFPRG